MTVETENPTGSTMDLPVPKAEETGDPKVYEFDKDITADGGVKKKVLQKGTGAATPETGDEVFVHYVGTLEDGTKFDSSRDRGQPFSFKLGTGSVIKAWDQGVATMKKGEKAILTCRSDYAYGAAGSPPKIPANATLKFEVELLSWKSAKDITHDGGVLKKTIKEGQKWKMPTEKDQVTVSYSVKVQGQDSPFVQSPQEGAEFYVKDGHFLRAFAIAVQTMKKGEKAGLTVQPAYGLLEPSQHPEVPPNAMLEAELELVSWKTVESVTEDGGVLKKVLNEVDAWQTAKEGAQVKVALKGWLDDGTVFEEHGHDALLEFVTDGDAVVEGLDLAVIGMHKGEKVELTVQPQYGFGAEAVQRPLALVPPNSVLHYNVELVEMQRAKEAYEMNDEEKIAEAGARKAKGNAAFKAGRWERAAKKYGGAVDLLEFQVERMPAELRAAAAEVMKSCRLNLAATHLKTGNHAEARKVCSKILEKDSFNVKALYRRAQTFMATQDYVEAEQDIKKALQTDPSNKEVRLLLRKCKEEVADLNKKQAEVYSKIFSKAQKTDDKRTPTQAMD